MIHSSMIYSLFHRIQVRTFTCSFLTFKAVLTTVLLFPLGNEFLERYNDSNDNSKEGEMSDAILKNRLDLIKMGISLAVQWLGLHASISGDMGSILSWGNSDPTGHGAWCSQKKKT